MTALGPTGQELEVTDIGNEGTIVGVNWSSAFNVGFRYTDSRGYEQLGLGRPITVEIELLNAVENRWVLDDEGAHRWGFMLLSFIAILPGH